MIFKSSQVPAETHDSEVAYISQEKREIVRPKNKATMEVSAGYSSTRSLVNEFYYTDISLVYSIQ